MIFHYSTFGFEKVYEIVSRMYLLLLTYKHDFDFNSCHLLAECPWPII